MSVGSTRPGTLALRRSALVVVAMVDSTSVGIYGADAHNVVVADAQRLTNSGTFIHAAPWNNLLTAQELLA